MKNKALSLVYLPPVVLEDNRYKFLHSLGLLHPGSLKEGEATILCFDVDISHHVYIEMTVIKPEKKHLKIRLPHSLVVAVLEVAFHKNQFGIPLESVAQPEELKGLGEIYS